MRSLLLALLLSPLSIIAQDSQPAPAAKPAAAAPRTKTVGPAPAAQQPVPAATQEHGPINWITLEQAQEAAKKDGKPIMMDVYTPWCGPCKMLSTQTFTDPKLAAYVNEHYHAVKFNAEGPDPVKYNGQVLTNPDYKPELGAGRNGTHQLTMQVAPVNGRIAYPTVVYMDKDGSILTPVQGYLTPQQMEPILIFFAEGYYKSEEFQKFYEGFKGTWGTP